MNNLAERLVSLRQGLSRREFAKVLGVTESTLRNYEKGSSSPDAQFLAELCKKMKVSSEWLLFGSESTCETDVFHEKIEVPAGVLTNECLRCGKLEQELKQEREERRELATENRRLYREKEALFREIGELREKLARLEAERGKRDDKGEGLGLPGF